MLMDIFLLMMELASIHMKTKTLPYGNLDMLKRLLTSGLNTVTMNMKHQKK